MRQLILIFLIGCATNHPDVDRNYPLTTPIYGIHIASEINVPDNELITRIDEQTGKFMDCQFGGDNVLFLPLDHLRVLVLGVNFECDSSPNGICKAEYMSAEDVIIIDYNYFPRAYRHELAHRYNYAADHSNYDIYKQCIVNPDNSGIIGN